MSDLAIAGASTIRPGTPVPIRTSRLRLKARDDHIAGKQHFASIKSVRVFHLMPVKTNIPVKQNELGE